MKAFTLKSKVHRKNWLPSLWNLHDEFYDRTIAQAYKKPFRYAM